MQKQKDAVINTILSVLEARGVTYEMDGETKLKDVLTSEDRAQVKAILFEGFMNREIELAEKSQNKLENESELKSYVAGLVTNWVKKYKPFNCGVAYQPENPGSRAGQGDEQVREMRKLLKITTDPEQKAEIQAAIDSRISEIKAERGHGTVTINVEALPENLRHLAN